MDNHWTIIGNANWKLRFLTILEHFWPIVLFLMSYLNIVLSIKQYIIILSVIISSSFPWSNDTCVLMFHVPDTINSDGKWEDFLSSQVSKLSGNERKQSWSLDEHKRILLLQTRAFVYSMTMQSVVMHKSHTFSSNLFHLINYSKFGRHELDK